MSKLSKLIKSPRKFFFDSRRNKFLKQIDNLNFKEVEHLATLKQKSENYQTPKKNSYQEKTKSKALKSQPEYLNQIIRLTDRYPVNLLADQEGSFWPYLRNELMVQLNVAWLKKIKVSQNFNPYMTQLCTRENIPFYWRDQLKVEGAKEAFEIEKDDVDFLFFTNLNSVDHVEINGKIHNRILDPIMEKAQEQGYKCKKIELIKAVGQGLKKLPNYNIEPLKLLPPFEQITGRFSSLNIPKNFLDIYKKEITYVPLVEEKRIHDFYDWQMHIRDMYLKLFSRLRPKAIFFHPYYYQTALVDAAKSLGIKTIDVQHGLQVGYNQVFYACWNEMPKGGYRQIPDHFWVWGEKERINIEEQFSSTAIMGGYPWLDKQLDFHDKYSTNLLNKLSTSKRIALITLQIDGYISDKVITYIKQSKDNFIWLIRRHPKGKDISNDIKNLPNVISGDIVNKSILAKILSKTDVHFSSGSTVIIEADYFGVYSYVYHEEGYQNFSSEIELGLVGHVDNSPINFEDLQYTDRNKQHPSLNAFYKPDYGIVFSEILNK